MPAICFPVHTGPAYIGVHVCMRYKCVPTSLLHSTFITITPTSQELKDADPNKTGETGMCLLISHTQSQPAPQKRQPVLIHKADLNINVDHGSVGPCVQGFPCGLNHLEAGASSGQLCPASHTVSLSPDPLCSQDMLWGNSDFPEANGGPRAFTRALAFAQKMEAPKS